MTNRTRKTVIRFFSTMAVIMVLALPASAKQLLMIEEAGCTWCELWDEEVGTIYANTEEGRKAPLVRHDIDDFPAGNLELDGSVHYAPTFIVVENGRELGRIVGYPGEDFFWQLLGQLLNEAEPP